MAAPGESPQSSTLDDALRAARLAQTHSGQAVTLAEAALRAGPDDPNVGAAATHALSMCAAVQGDLTRAIELSRKAIAIATAARLATRAVEARGVLAVLLVYTGHSRAALHELGLARAARPGGVVLARLQMQQGLVHSEIGRLHEARGFFDSALDTVRGAGGDDHLEADILSNRAIALAELRDWTAAESDLVRATAVYERSGLTGRTALVLHNRGRLQTLRGDIPAALVAFDEAADRYRQAGTLSGLLVVERAEALLAARLVGEARRAAADAVTTFAEQRNAVDLVQARLVLAEAALVDHDQVTAADQARHARREARAQGRPHWAALAGYLHLRARWADGATDADVLRAARRAADELGAAGWVVQGVDARLVAARIALARGRSATARAELGRIPVALRRTAPAQLRARAWHAEALLRRADGDRTGAARAVRAGLGVLDRYRTGLGATDLRAHAADHAAELAGLGVELAREAGSATAVLTAVERARSGALWTRPARPPDDPFLAAELAELRQVAGRLGSEDADVPRLLARQAALEIAIRDRARHAVGSGTPGLEPTVARLSAALGDATLVEYAALHGELFAVVVSAGRCTMLDLGRADAVVADIDALRTAVGWLARDGARPRAVSATLDLVHRAAGALEDRLLMPLPRSASTGPLVVVPTGVLHALPWPALPATSGRAVTVAPSAASWLRATCANASDAAPTVLAHGPRLTHAASEITALATRYPGANCLLGADAGVDPVLAALDGAGIAHLAAHGRFRSDNPMFSQLEFADGPLTVYDLERLAAPPERVVLAACDAGVSGVRTGDQLIGLAAALLAMGTRSLVAAVLPVSDEASHALMASLHEHLAAGSPVSLALAIARAETAPDSPQSFAAATAFSCFGAGGEAVARGSRGEFGPPRHPE